MPSSGVLPPAVRPPQFSSVQIKARTEQGVRPPQFSSIQIKGGARRHARTEQGARPPQFSSVQIKGGARGHAPLLSLRLLCFALLCVVPPLVEASSGSGPAFYKTPKQNAAVQARYFVRFNNW